jgi:WD40 repeat protein
MRTSRLTGLALLAGALAAVLTGGVLVRAAASHAAASNRAGTIAFIRVVPGPSFVGQLFSVRADGSGLRRVTPPNTNVYSYAWSPDGRLIAYIDQRFSLWLVRPDGTGRRLLLPTSQLSSLGLSWSPDGKNIAIVSPGRSANRRNTACANLALYVVPIGGGKPVQVSPPRHGIGWASRGLRSAARSPTETAAKSSASSPHTVACREYSSPPGSVRRSGHRMGQSSPPPP